MIVLYFLIIIKIWGEGQISLFLLLIIQLWRLYMYHLNNRISSLVLGLFFLGSFSILPISPSNLSATTTNENVSIANENSLITKKGDGHKHGGHHHHHGHKHHGGHHKVGRHGNRGWYGSYGISSPFFYSSYPNSYQSYRSYNSSPYYDTYSRPYVYPDNYYYYSLPVIYDVY